MAFDPNDPNDPNHYPKMIDVNGAKFEARDAEHEKALKAGKPDPQVLAAERARLDADAAEAKRVADEAAVKAKEAAAAATLKPGDVKADPAAVDAEARRTQGRDQDAAAAKPAKAAKSGKKK